MPAFRCEAIVTPGTTSTRAPAPAGDGGRVVARPAVDDDDLVGPIEVGERLAEPARLVERRHDDRHRDALCRRELPGCASDPRSRRRTVLLQHRRPWPVEETLEVKTRPIVRRGPVQTTNGEARAEGVVRIAIPRARAPRRMIRAGCGDGRHRGVLRGTFVKQYSRGSAERADKLPVSPSPRLKTPGSEIGAFPVIGARPISAAAAARSRSSLTAYAARKLPTAGNCPIRYGFPNATTTVRWRRDSASIHAAIGCGTATRPCPSTRRTYAVTITVLAASAARSSESSMSRVAPGPIRATSTARRRLPRAARRAQRRLEGLARLDLRLRRVANDQHAAGVAGDRHEIVAVAQQRERALRDARRDRAMLGRPDDLAQPLERHDPRSARHPTAP